MKSEKLKSFLKGIWSFASYVFIHQRRPPQGRWCHGNMVSRLLLFSVSYFIINTIAFMGYGIRPIYIILIK